MTGTQLSESTNAPVAKTTLEYRAIVWFSQKVQVIIAAILMAIVIGVCFGSSLTIGFLLDDFLHLEYSMRALHNEWAPLLGNLFGNWGDSDLMRSYRPIASLSIFIDALVGGRTDAWRYHLTNLILYFVCCCLVSLVTLELTGRRGNRLSGAAALWAGLLFAVYPLHPESVAWIIGRVDVLCGAFYLASVFLFLRFQLIREKSILVLSLISFLLALLSKEMAVTVPVVITMAAFLLKPDYDRASAKTRMTWVGYFWALLIVYSLGRHFLLGTTIGGYGESSAVDLLNSWRAFLDRASLTKIFVGINEEYHPIRIMAKLVVPAYIAIGVCLLSKVVLMRGRTLNTFLFLLAWMIVALIPTFQIWHIFPNLVGSRLFFISSAPLCILLTLAALPALELLGDKVARATTIFGSIALFYLFLSWTMLTRQNMQAWIDAGTYTQTFKEELHAISARVKDNPVLVLNLPRDNRGAGMITREKYMNILMTPSLTPGKADNAKFISIEPNVTGDPLLMWPNRFACMMNGLSDGQIVRWSTTTNHLMPWGHAENGSKEPLNIERVSAEQFSAEPPCTLLDSQKWNRVLNKAPLLEVLDGTLRIYPGEHGGGVTLWLKMVSEQAPLDPLKLSMLTLNMVSKPIDAGNSANSLKGASVVWESSDPDGNSGEAPLNRDVGRESESGAWVAWLGRYRTWTLAPSIKRLGLHFDSGNRCYELNSLNLFDATQITPVVLLKDRDVSYDVSKVPRAKSAQIFVSATNQTFDTTDSGNVVEPKLPPILAKLPCQGVSGKVRLPETIYNEPGYHEIQVVALDIDGRRVGVASEPIPLIIDRTNK